MITQILHCPYCQGVILVKNGKASQQKQRYQCREEPCSGRTFILNYAYRSSVQKSKRCDCRHGT